MQEQKEEKKKIPIPQIMLILLQQLNYTAHKKEAVLQCEESGSKVANLQGFLAGVRSYKKALAITATYSTSSLTARTMRTSKNCCRKP